MKKLSVFLTMALLVLSGCTGEIEEKDGRLGTEATPEEMQKAINKAFAGVSIAKAKKGHSVLYEDNYVIETSPTIATQLIKQTVIGVQENETQMAFDMFQDVYSIAMDGSIVDEKHSQLDTLVFEKALVASNKLNSFSLSEIQTKLTRTEANVCDGKEIPDDKGNPYDCIRYFNLIIEKTKIDAPNAVRAKPNCLNLPECKITGYLLSYDEVVWAKNRAQETVSWTYHITSQVPDIMYTPTGNNVNYTPAVSSLCAKYKVLHEGTKYNKRDCRVLRDFSNIETP